MAGSRLNLRSIVQQALTCSVITSPPPVSYDCIQQGLDAETSHKLHWMHCNDMLRHMHQPAAVLDQPGHLVSNDIPSSVFSHNILFPAHHSGNTVQLQASSSNCCKNHTHCSTNLFFNFTWHSGTRRLLPLQYAGFSRLAHAAAEFRPDDCTRKTLA